MSGLEDRLNEVERQLLISQERERDLAVARDRERARRQVDRNGRAARDFAHLFVDAVGDAAAVIAENPETSMFVFSVGAFFFGFNPFNYALNWAIGRVWPFRM
jgi:hypothetical protein